MNRYLHLYKLLLFIETACFDLEMSGYWLIIGQNLYFRISEYFDILIIRMTKTIFFHLIYNKYYI